MRMPYSAATTLAAALSASHRKRLHAHIGGDVNRVVRSECNGSVIMHLEERERGGALRLIMTRGAEYRGGGGLGPGTPLN